MDDPVREIRKAMVGKRVELIRCTDEYTQIKPGEQGTVSFVDHAGTVFVDWDSGSGLGLVPGEDRWKIL